MVLHVIPELISLAKTSNMTSKHAAAVICGKRILSMATNHSLPAGELVDFAAKTNHEKKGHCYQQCSFGSTPFNMLCERCEESKYRFEERYRKMVLDLRCQKDTQIAHTNKENWIGSCTTC